LEKLPNYAVKQVQITGRRVQASRKPSAGSGGEKLEGARTQYAIAPRSRRQPELVGRYGGDRSTGWPELGKEAGCEMQFLARAGFRMGINHLLGLGLNWAARRSWHSRPGLAVMDQRQCS